MRQTRRQTRRKTQTRRHAWGHHLTVDARGCDHAAISSKEVIRAFITELVPAIDMVAYGAPRIVRFGSGNKMGYTLVQLIQTSDITCHYCEENDAAYLDVFSCKTFEKKDVLRVFMKYFKPKGMKVRLMARNAS